LVNFLSNLIFIPHDIYQYCSDEQREGLIVDFIDPLAEMGGCLQAIYQTRKSSWDLINIGKKLKGP